MKLIFVRHGQTVENAAGIIQGQLDTELTDLGREQAAKLAERLKEMSFDCVYSSDLKRAKHTADAIVKYHPDVPFTCTRDARERNWGDMQAKKRSEVRAKWDELVKKHGNDPALAPPGGESFVDLYKRADRFVHKLLKKHRGQTVLLVAHGLFNKALICAIMEKEPAYLIDMERHGNTSVNIIEFFEGRDHKIHLLNCIEHLG